MENRSTARRVLAALALACALISGLGIATTAPVLAIGLGLLAVAVLL